MRTLVQTITEKASTSFGKPLTKENYKEWFNHWIETGIKWAKELDEEGLFVTARAVRDHVEWEQKAGVPKLGDVIKNG